MEEHYLKQELYERMLADHELFEWLQAGSLDGIWYWDLENPVEEWLSPRFKEVFGYKDEEIPNSSAWWQENIFPEDLELAKQNFEAHIQNGAPYDQVVRYRHRDGSTVWVRCRGKALFNDEGKAIRMLGAHTDVTEMQLNTLQLEENELQLRLAMEAAEIGSWRWDLGSGDLEWSSRCYEMFGVSEAVPMTYEAFISGVEPIDRKVVEEAIQACLEKGQDYESKFRWNRPDGSKRWFQAKGLVQRDEAGTPHILRGVVLDVTEEAVAEEELQWANEELRRSNEELRQFARVASHDLKSPLRGIKSLTGWIVEDCGNELPERSREDLLLLQQRVDRLEKLLDSLLTYARVGRREGEPEQVDTGRLLQESVDLLMVPNEFTITLKGAFPYIRAPRAALQRIFGNLLGNAVKHHDRADGKIVISYRLTRDYHEFFISDDGPGIPAEFHERVFQMFQTLKPRDEIEGSGMGLALVKKTVETLGGNLRLESEAGKGAVFTVNIPTGTDDFVEE